MIEEVGTKNPDLDFFSKELFDKNVIFSVYKFKQIISACALSEN